MIKRVKLSATQGASPAPTGFRPVRIAVAPAPRDTTRPVGKDSFNAFAGVIGFSGVDRNAPKPRPHILQGWKSPR